MSAYLKGTTANVKHAVNGRPDRSFRQNLTMGKFQVS